MIDEPTSPRTLFEAGHPVTEAERIMAESVRDPRNLTRYLYYLRTAREEGLPLLVAPLDAAVNWSRANAIWPLTFGLACCAIEMMAVGASRFDLDRFGAGAFRPTPRQADLMIVAGTVTHKMAPRVKRLYDQMPEPKYVMAMGACTIGGGPYSVHGYHVVKGIDRFIPVSVYVPGCPPRPEALIDALLWLQQQIAKEHPISSRYVPKRWRHSKESPFEGGAGGCCVDSPSLNSEIPNIPLHPLQRGKTDSHS
jgi:NADH-quinone oxidoreductase subunit B